MRFLNIFVFHTHILRILDRTFSSSSDGLLPVSYRAVYSHNAVCNDTPRNINYNSYTPNLLIRQNVPFTADRPRVSNVLFFALSYTRVFVRFFIRRFVSIYFELKRSSRYIIM